MELTTPIVDTALIAATARRADSARAGANLRAGTNPEAVRQAARDFEAVFVAQMLAPMFEGLASDGMFGGGPGENIYRSILVDEYGKAVASAGGIGIADQVQREILRAQEAASQ